MALSRDLQRATLAIRDVLASGGRVLRSSRAFWARYGFPPIEQRTAAIAAARDLYNIANEIEAGTIRGTLAEALTDAGLPTSDIAGGLTGGPEGTIYGRAQYVNDQGLFVYRSFKLDLPWYSSLDQLTSAVEGLIDTLGERYGLGQGVAVPGSLVVY